jgi:hypothetical protein
LDVKQFGQKGNVKPEGICKFLKLKY